MKTVYEAANAVEAHMLQALLQQEGIATRIDGEFLTGALGELPTARLVRLMADEDSYPAARAAIERWEATDVIDPLPPLAERHRGNTWIAALAALAVGIAGSWAFFRSPVSADGIDHNRDGVLDERWTFSPRGTLLEATVDRNLDGKVDHIARYDRRGLIERSESDDNFDGVFETRQQYRAGNVETTETDTDGDGLADLRSHFEHGVLRTVEYVDPRSGLPLRIEHLQLGRVETAEVDSDGDGRLDTRVHYSRSGAPTRSQRIDATR
ncbi:DUF2007 domain-containing protein [Aquincola sp. S2]|uniref:DUF2007 domain-containing protein n=1 Tax=Pseudaquabacterium terrae TaxID=2732868 RepID=A0ABX2ETU7_9BURK|nr:DUF2007 domain-containing protein [Aquabacterium terrae]NRF72139.1 DUF2007 domain-containing protein [Aquabacterium terrae]